MEPEPGSPEAATHRAVGLLKCSKETRELLFAHADAAVFDRKLEASCVRLSVIARVQGHVPELRDLIELPTRFTRT
jgi:hypothetical protein